MSDVINAVKRLERAGSENSRATTKLHEAASEVAQLIQGHVPPRKKLPRGYYVWFVRSNVGESTFLCLDSGSDDEPDYWIDGCGGYLHGDFNCPIPGQTREGSLRFAKDVADGLLDEIAEWLENGAKQGEQATASLQSAIDERK